MNYVGSKRRIVKNLVHFFPKHEIYLEPFLGGGSVFFYKQPSKFNIMNDINSEVFDFFITIKENKENFLNEIENLLIHESLLKYYKNKEKTILENALFFVFKNLFTYLGSGETLRCSNHDVFLSKEKIKEKIKIFHEKLKNSIIMNKDFREFFKSITMRHESDYKRIFIYCDPPYLNSSKHYKVNWKQTDLIDLIEILKDFEKKESNFIISEKESNEINEIAKEFNLNIIEVKKINYMSRKEVNEIILTNVKKNLLF